MRTIIWDFDGVILTGYGGKATTMLAEQRPGKPNEYIERFRREAGTPNHPLSVVTAEELNYAWAEWSATRNSGRPIETFGELARCLTDLRHKIQTNREDKKGNVFPGPEQTVYTKNALLEGLSLRDVYEIVHKATLTKGFKEAVERFREQAFRQLLFSETLQPVVDYFVFLHSLNYGEAVPPVINLDGQELVYGTGNQRHPLRATLTGKMGEAKKEENIFRYLEKEKMPLENVAAIGDSKTDIPIIRRIRSAGGAGFGFNTGKYTGDYKSAGIPIIKGLELSAFAEAVINPSSVRDLCDLEYKEI